MVLLLTGKTLNSSPCQSVACSGHSKSSCRLQTGQVSWWTASRRSEREGSQILLDEVMGALCVPPAGRFAVRRSPALCTAFIQAPLKIIGGSLQNKRGEGNHVCSFSKNSAFDEDWGGGCAACERASSSITSKLLLSISSS